MELFSIKIRCTFQLVSTVSDGIKQYLPNIKDKQYEIEAV